MVDPMPTHDLTSPCHDRSGPPRQSLGRMTLHIADKLRRRRRKDEGTEGVTVEPPNLKPLLGGAAAALEFDR